VNADMDRFLFTARRYASAVYAVVVYRLSVCPFVRHMPEFF